MSQTSSVSARSTRARALRALRDAFIRDHPAVEVDDRGYVPAAADNLVPSVRLRDFEADLRAGDGNELRDKFRAIHSSSALAVNVFGPFRDRTRELSLPVPGAFAGLQFEAKCPTGVSSQPANLDLLLTGLGGIVGVESKLTEHLSRHRAAFSPRYRERIRDERRQSAWFREMLCLEEDPRRYAWLDAAQLVKHAFGLARTFPDGALTLLYLYWEPRHAEQLPPFAGHRCEVEAFSARVAGSRPTFRALAYPELWACWSGKTRPWLSAHLDALRARYDVDL